MTKASNFSAIQYKRNYKYAAGKGIQQNRKSQLVKVKPNGTTGPKHHY